MSMTMSMTAMASSTMSMMPTSTSMGSMGGMGGMGGMGQPGACKISMLWNWYTIDSCFLARSWHIRTTAQFAGSCIGVAMLVVALEFVRRAQREYDRYIISQAKQSTSATITSENTSETSLNKTPIVGYVTKPFGPKMAGPTAFQQVIRSAFYMVQFTVAYLIMLLAMYYNGYLIISIILGAFLGHFIWAWDNITFGVNHQETGTSCC